MTSKEFFLALDELEKEKGISKDKVIESLQTALTIACKKNFGEASNVVVHTNPEKFTIRAYICKLRKWKSPKTKFPSKPHAKSKSRTKSATKC